MIRFVSAALALLFCVSTSYAKAPPTTDSQLEAKIGQLLVIGFIGMEPSPTAVNAIREHKVGGVILFDRNVSDKLPAGGYGTRNIKSPAQVRCLTDSLQALARAAGLPQLFIAIDQEGGLVNRLKASYGFPATVSAEYQGKIGIDDTTRKYAAATAATLVASGININYAPCADLAINPENPIIAKVQRAFGATAADVTRHNRIWVDEHRKAGVLTSLKHYPGHGSSREDSHLGLPDISATWQECEIEPYRTLTAEGYDDIVMIGHLVCRRFDTELPASLSKKTIGYLRDSIGYKGIVATDDLNMGAIIDNYSLPHALELALNAGVDMVVMGNNAAKFEGDLVERTVRIICELVAQGKVSQETIDRAYQRVMELKKRLKSR